MRHGVVFGFLVVNSLLAGCSSVEKPPGTSLTDVSLISTKDVNTNTAITVDLVAVYDKELFGKLKEMPSAAYFGSIDQMRRDNMSAVEIFRWEMVPGQILEGYEPQIAKDRTWGLIFFADYQTPGAHRAVVGQTDAARLVLGSKDIDALEPRKYSENPKKRFQKYPENATLILNTRPSKDGESTPEGEAGDTESTTPEAKAAPQSPATAAPEEASEA